MKLNEEIELVHFVLGMVEGLFNNQNKIHDEYIDLPEGASLTVTINDGNVYVKFKPTYGGENHTVFSFDASDYTNVMANNCWTFNFHKNGDFSENYSIVNSLDDIIKLEEEYIDSLCQNGRIITEDEYFQASLVHPDMPETYEDAVLILETLREGREKYKLDKCSVAIYISEYTTMKLMRKIRRQLIFKFGIKFI